MGRGGRLPASQRGPLRVPRPDLGALPWQRLAELAACRGDLDEVGPALRKASAIATVSPTARHLWGRIHATAAFARLQQGDPEFAARSVRAAAAAAARGGDCPSCSALLHPVAAQTYALLGRADLAREHAAAAAAVADGFGGSAWRAMAQAAAGSAAAADGDAGAARAQFEESSDSYLRAGHTYWAEYARRQAFDLADLAGVGWHGGRPVPLGRGTGRHRLRQPPRPGRRAPRSR